MNPAPVRLVIVLDDLLGGGAARVATLLANAWAGKGFQVTLVTSDDGTGCPIYALAPGVGHRPLDLRREPRHLLEAVWNNLSRVRRLRKAIRGLQPTAVISFLDRTNVLVLLATVGLGLPVVVSERSDPHGRSIGRAWELLRTATYPFAAAVVAQTRHALDYFSAGIQARGRVIPNPVALPEEVPPRRDPWTRTPPFTVVSVGSLRPVKGHDLLIEAFAQVAGRHPDWNLRIHGEGPARGDLEQQVARLGLQGRVELPGATTAPFERLREADLFVLSSRTEGFPNALAEAMACGLPVISFDCRSGPSELIRTGENGILVPPGQVEELAAAMDRLMADRAERSRLAEGAPEVLSRFSLERILAQWEALVLGAQPPPPPGPGRP